MVRNAASLLGGHLGGAHIKPFVDLHRIGADDLPAELLGQRNAQRGLAGSRGAEAGVLSRVAGLFSRRGYNIDSLTVGETQDKRHSRMTVVAEGEPEVLEQIEKQLAKLVDVSKIQMLPADASVCIG